VSNRLRVAVVGVGRMGRHHARIYSELDNAELVGVVDADLARAEEVASQFGCQAWDRVDLLLGQVQAVSVAVPTSSHRQIVEPLLRGGLAVLVEKPLADTVTNGRVLVEAARASGSLLQVGHTERFNPVVTAVERMEVEPKFIEADRISPFTFRSADVGVVLDMMIHDLDIVLHLVRDKPARVEAVGVSVLSRHEDIANARITFAGGCVANVTASRLALKTERKIRVFSEQAYLSLDYQRRSGIAVKKDANLDVLDLARKHQLDDLSQLQGLDFLKLVHVEPLQIDDVEPLRSELEAFLDSVDNGSPPVVSAEEGLAAMELADQIVAAIGRHRLSADEPSGQSGD
jgi:predicted dehydrogenase